MKNGGYQILELNCKSNLKIIDDYKNAIAENFVKIIDYEDEEKFLLDLFKYNKTCLLKNLLINNQFITLFSNVFTNEDSIDIYVVDSSQEGGYLNINPYEYDLFIIKLNDDYILVINLNGEGLITKLYKGAITE